MPPKIDPYATPRARTFDVILWFLAIMAIVIAIHTAPQHRSSSGNDFTRAPALSH